MSKHFIYHIFGKKVGVTNDIVRRMREQSVKEGEYEILEEHTNAKTASVREQELQVQHGYRVDNIPYYKTLINQKKAHTPEAQAKRAANTDYKARTANTDYKAIVAKIDYKALSIKRAANTDYKVVSAKRVINTDWKAKAEKQKKPINQYDLNNNFIKTWPSAKEAAEKLNFDNADIGKCCRGKYKTSGGYVWKYAN
jgi:hypothetical protein